MIRFLISALTATALFAGFGNTAAAQSLLSSGTQGRVSKKGLAGYDRTNQLKVGWFYNWGPNRPADTPAGVEFVPMIWGWRAGDSEQFLQSLPEKKRAGVFHTLLGFNEPDGKDQADIPVEIAVEKWPLLMETGLRLVSPGAVHPDNAWMIEFMKQAQEKKLRVDVIAVHWYGGPDATGFLNYLERVYKRYRRPLWITEFAVADWSAKPDRPNRYTTRQVEQFMRVVIPALKRTHYIERFAWFKTTPKSVVMGISALVNEDGSPTKLGLQYANY